MPSAVSSESTINSRISPTERLQDALARQCAHLAPHGALHLPGEERRGRDQQRLRIRAVLRLSQKIGGDEFRARAFPSAITMTSVTPAGRSAAAPAGSPATSDFAAATQAFPGPNSLSHLGIDSVP